MTGHSRTTTSSKKELCTRCYVCVVKMQLTNKTILLDIEASDTNDNVKTQDPENQHEAQHEQLSVRVVLQSS